MASKPYRVLARKYRPESFDAVVGQQHITRTLQNAIRSGRVGHAFLFIGSRGIGKTTSARILAKALNCLSSEEPTPEPCLECDNCTSIARGNNMDVIEIDGASNNSVDNVREIRENVSMVPANSRYKIYIIDEVHQLSSGAFNALLKTLEEPPPHAKFILATTEAHKVPATIISRCQRYDFRRVGQRDIQQLLAGICDHENISYTDEALMAIARAADGGIRDSESILDQVISYSGDTITYEAVFDVLGLVDWDVLHKLCDALIAKDIGTMLGIVDEVTVSGKDLPQFMQETLRYFRNLLLCRSAGDPAILALPEEETAAMQQRADQFSLTELVRLVEQMSELFKRDFDVQLAPRIAFEAFLIRVSKVAVEVSVDSVLEKLAHMGAGGVLPQDAAAAPQASTPSKAKAKESPKASEPAKPKPKATAAAGKAPPDIPPPAPLPESSAPVAQAEAPVQRVSLEAGNLLPAWRDLVEVARKQSLNLGVWLGAARPRAIEGECLVLGLDEDQADTRDRLERAGAREAINALLATHTTNAVEFRIDWNPASESRDDAPVNGQLSGGAAVDLAARVLKDEALARIVDVFKGKVVEVRPLPQETTVEPD